MKKKDSYTSASAMPFKLLKDIDFLTHISKTKKIMMRHLQICPTNKCNLNCPWCFAKGTMILTDKGSEPIENIKIGDNIISGKRKIKKVISISDRKVNEYLYIKLKGIPNLKVTPEHPFYYNGKYIPAKELREGMDLEIVKPVLCFNSLNKNRQMGRPKEILYLSKMFKNKRYHSKRRGEKGYDEIGRFRLKDSKHSAPQKMLYDFDFGRFCGLYLAEGHITKRKNRLNSQNINFSFGKHEDEYISFIKDFCDRYGFSYSESCYDYATCYQISINNSIFTEFIKKYFGMKGMEKRIPFELRFNYSFVKGLIRGIFDGDGHYARNYLNLVNKKLLFDIYQILLNMGFLPFYWERKGGWTTIEGRDVLGKRSYSFGIMKKQWKSFNNFITDGINHWRHHNPLPYMASIKKITKMKSSISVYNFSVEKDKSYFANFIHCHNCSCNAREREEELDIEQLIEIMNIAKELGIVGVTITGGGEPVLHPHINAFIDYTDSIGIKMGLVSNAIALGRLSPENLNKLTWARISFGDFREFDKKFIDNMNHLRKSGKDVDLAFSYVVSKDYDIQKLFKIVEYANANNFTHVRIVPDLYNVEEIDMNQVEMELEPLVDLKLCIFQKRTDYTNGLKDCAVSLLKPMIAPDGYIYPCCGVQYSLASSESQRTFPHEMRMGHYKDLPDIEEKYDGSKCVKCYYENYNVLLNNLQKDYEHVEFV